MARLLSKSPEMSNSPITATKDARNLGKSLQTVVLARLGNLRNLRPPDPNGVSSTSAISFSLGLVSSPSSSSMRSSSTGTAVVVVVNFLVGFLVPGLRVVVVVRLTTGFFVVEIGFLEEVGFLTGALVDKLDSGCLEYSWTFVVDEETSTALGSSAISVVDAILCGIRMFQMFDWDDFCIGLLTGPESTTCQIELPRSQSVLVFNILTVAPKAFAFTRKGEGSLDLFEEFQINDDNGLQENSYFHNCDFSVIAFNLVSGAAKSNNKCNSKCNSSGNSTLSIAAADQSVKFTDSVTGMIVVSTTMNCFKHAYDITHI
uniref:Uncharacterized protein n=1 Tax=Glossina austeni TaxID=7395 RepID=A0A1A9UZD7_GLOAU